MINKKAADNSNIIKKREQDIIASELNIRTDPISVFEKQALLK